MIISDILDNALVTNSIELNELGTQLFGDDFKGVFPSDMIPELYDDGECLIFNSKSSKSKGEHWLALYRYCDNSYVFDTYNRDMEEINKDFISKDWINIKHMRLESLYGSDCGQQCLAFLATVRKYGIKAFYEAFKE